MLPSGRAWLRLAALKFQLEAWLGIASRAFWSAPALAGLPLLLHHAHFPCRCQTLTLDAAKLCLPQPAWPPAAAAPAAAWQPARPAAAAPAAAWRPARPAASSPPTLPCASPPPPCSPCRAAPAHWPAALAARLAAPPAAGPAGAAWPPAPAAQPTWRAPLLRRLWTWMQPGALPPLLPGRSALAASLGPARLALAALPPPPPLLSPRCPCRWQQGPCCCWCRPRPTSPPAARRHAAPGPLPAAALMGWPGKQGGRPPPPLHLRLDPAQQQRPTTALAGGWPLQRLPAAARCCVRLQGLPGPGARRCRRLRDW
jgi:hypothetical protein